jgi:hypothetical protein
LDKSDSQEGKAEEKEEVQNSEKQALVSFALGRR